MKLAKGRAATLLLAMLAAVAIDADLASRARAVERLETERFTLDITPQSVALDGGGHRAVIKRIPAARKAVSLEYHQENDEGGIATITATAKNMVAIRQEVDAYLKRPQYVATVTVEKDGKPIDCAAACKVAVVEGRSEVHKVLADVGKLNDAETWSDEIDLGWTDKGDHLDVHVVADYDEGKGRHGHVDTIQLMKVNENSAIYLEGAPVRLMLRIERAPG